MTNSVSKKFATMDWHSLFRHSKTEAPVIMWFNCNPMGFFPLWTLFAVYHPTERFAHAAGVLKTRDDAAEENGIFLSELSVCLAKCNLDYNDGFTASDDRGSLVFTAVTREVDSMGIYDTVVDYILTRAKWYERQDKRRRKLAQKYFDTTSEHLDYNDYETYVAVGMEKWEKRNPPPKGILSHTDIRKRHDTELQGLSERP